MRRPEADLLTKEQTAALMQEVNQMKLRLSIVAKDLGVTYNAPYAWSKGTARAPKALEAYLESKRT